jgi:DNA helicase-2/ATP-dependent DNA helicase PcrA
VTATATRRLSAAEVSALLGSPHPPTPEQAAVVEAPLAPQLVVAGAGSGKTETMAARVVWLVANGMVAPDQVLGLTFTRKAAGELAERVGRRLRTLHRATGTGVDPLTALPRVSTYNAYAASLVADHGLRLGLEPGARLLGEAATWQLAQEVVETWDGDLETLGYALDTVVGAVLSLAGQCAEHLREPAEVAAYVEQVEAALALLPKDDEGGAPAQPAPSTDLAKALRSMRARRLLVPVVQAYLDRKRDLGVLDFGDQVSLAAWLARLPEVAAAERSQYGVVLLDEYQDTSHAQLALLASLFGDGHAVTAVGDPHQSIYGWRGASADNLDTFRTTFRGADGTEARVDGLTTSWRNPTSVLDLANAVAAPLTEHGRVPVEPLRARPDAPAGRVRASWHATTEDEARDLAEQVHRVWRAPGARTVAVLCRQRAQFPAVEKALRALDLPVEVVGLGGLLHRPEVADVVATLRVLHDPSRGDALVRLLTSPRWRTGARDLVALGAWARHLARPLAEQDPTAVHDPDQVDDSSVVEALDQLPPPGWRSAAGHSLSEPGRERLVRLAAELARLRRTADLSLPELVAEVERALLLDVELAATAGPAAASARTQLDTFTDVAARFADTADRPTLGAFLSWLRSAEAKERALELGEEGTTSITGHEGDDGVVPEDVRANPNAVQVLTVHAAKGLEWDVVAVPGLVEGRFPSGSTKEGRDSAPGWLTPVGLLPYELRGDAAALPSWPWRSVPHLKAAARSVVDHKLDCGAHEVLEERRLAYVAFTRAREQLLLSGSWWGSRKSVLRPSRFLVEVLDATALSPLVDRVGCEPADLAQEPEGPNPLQAVQEVRPWPTDPAGEARPVLDRAAAAVRAAAAAGPTEQAPLRGVFAALGDEVDRLLAERDLLRATRHEVVLPSHLSASRAVRLARDPDELALALRRPVPVEPRRQTRLGTSFHEWVEQQLRSQALLDLDELEGAGDERDGPPPELAALQQTFLASEWAGREVVDVEVDVETSVAGTVLRGRVDAVFRAPKGPDGSPRYDVVDWKTGPVPRGADLEAARVQLAVYRLAWARLRGLRADQVGAAFFHVGAGVTVRLPDDVGERALVDLLGSVVVAGRVG